MHVRRLTNQILNFSRRQPHDTRLADFGKLILNMDDLLRQVASGAIALRLEAAPEPLPVLVDAGQLELALLNLARHAADAMREGGTLTISARRMDRADDKAGTELPGDNYDKRFRVD